jgi:Bacteriophage T4-like portal protein (Gp20)
LVEIFGFEIKKRQTLEDKPNVAASFVAPQTDDGAVQIAAGGAYGTYYDMDGTIRSEAELISRYREMSVNHEIDSAIDEIVNEAIVMTDEDPVVELNLREDAQIPDVIKRLIEQEFNNVLNILDFNKYAYQIFRRWYIDGRLYYHVVIDENDPNAGIQEVRYVDPRKIRKIREVTKVKDKNTGAVLPKLKSEYYIYNETGFQKAKQTPITSDQGTTGLKIAKDSIVYINSGLVDANNSMVLGYLHKAIKPLNQLRALEDATVIYTISRAPERRIFYIDVGNLPKMKAEQYLRDLMVKHKNKLVYDANTGEIKDDRRIMTMLEDYWLPRYSGGRGTEISTLPAGQNLGEMEHVSYFQKKLYKALNVPNSRLDSENSIYSLGRATEISRDEIKFSKFITRLRKQFSDLFFALLEKQLVLKQIMTPDEWNEYYRQNILFRFNKDNYFDELKIIEIMNDRMNLLGTMQTFTGQYYSHKWIRKNILKQTDEEMALIDDEIAAEVNDPQYINPFMQQEDPNDPGDPILPPEKAAPKPKTQPSKKK